jgi:hypothetical protein
LRIRRIELTEPARDEIGRGARALNVLESLQRRAVDRLGGAAVDLDLRVERLGVDQPVGQSALICARPSLLSSPVP